MSSDDFQRFPLTQDSKQDINPAIRAFGRRFLHGQTPLEYLAEFLLVYASPKGPKDGVSKAGFPEIEGTPKELVYFPKSRLPLKLFAFFPASKLETRHPAHVERFRQLVRDTAAAITPTEGGSQLEAVQVLQQLFAGFVGVSGQRTWATHAFVPASRSLLSCEVDWRHTAAINDRMITDETDWESFEKYFVTTSHNFMARGGELLFLQLWHLTTSGDRSEMSSGDYAHLNQDRLLERVDQGLGDLIDKIDEPLEQLGGFVERAATHKPEIHDPAGGSRFGWIYRTTWREATLFAWEVANVCGSSHDPLRKLRMLQDLCCLHVLRSICIQAARLSPGNGGSTRGFVGGYVWLVSPPDAGGTDIGKAAHASLVETEGLLFRALRSPLLPKGDAPKSQDDDNALGLFRSLGKQLGIIVPRVGPGARFTLNSRIIEAFVAALVEPGTRIRTDEFLRRIRAHFGMAVGAVEIAAAVNAVGGQARFSPANDCSAWLEEELQRGGLLIPLSDAVSMVVNSPAAGNDR